MKGAFPTFFVIDEKRTRLRMFQRNVPGKQYEMHQIDAKTYNNFRRSITYLGYWQCRCKHYQGNNFLPRHTPSATVEVFANRLIFEVLGCQRSNPAVLEGNIEAAVQLWIFGTDINEILTMACWICLTNGLLSKSYPVKNCWILKNAVLNWRSGTITY